MRTGRVIGVVSRRSARMSTIRAARPSQCARGLKRGYEKQRIADAAAVDTAQATQTEEWLLKSCHYSNRNTLELVEGMRRSSAGV